jgi:GNAT superfamily N-acetyltransferase
MIRLHAMTDADFAWMLGETDAHADGLTMAEGGLAPDAVLAMLRGITAGIAAGEDRPVAWLASKGDIVLAMVSFTKRSSDGRYEIGYGTAPAFGGQGVMTRTLAVLLPIVRAQGHDGLIAETSVDNPGSQRVLEKNGFVRTGTRLDPEDGALICWAIDWDHSSVIPAKAGIHIP